MRARERQEGKGRSSAREETKRREKRNALDEERPESRRGVRWMERGGGGGGRWYHQVARTEAGQGQNVVEPSRIIFSASYYCAKHKSVKCLGGRFNGGVHRYTLATPRLLVVCSRRFWNCSCFTSRPCITCASIANRLAGRCWSFHGLG